MELIYCTVAQCELFCSVSQNNKQITQTVNDMMDITAHYTPKTEAAVTISVWQQKNLHNGVI